MPRTVQIGDVIEVPTKLGYAYAQFSHYHSKPPRYGALLRILPGIFRERPKDFAELVAKREEFSVFFPLQAAIDKGIFSVVANEAIPPKAKQFPLFRAGNINPATGKVEQWWLWDGDESRRTEGLTDKQLDLPIKSIWNDTMLVKRIEQGWTPRNAEYFVALARAKKKSSGPEVISQIRHYLQLKSRADAEVAIQRIGELDLRSEIQEYDGECVVVVFQDRIIPEERERIRAYLSDVAAALGGEYEGWEFKIGGEQSETSIPS